MKKGHDDTWTKSYNKSTKTVKIGYPRTPKYRMYWNLQRHKIHIVTIQ